MSSHPGEFGNGFRPSVQEVASSLDRATVFQRLQMHLVGSEEVTQRFPDATRIARIAEQLRTPGFVQLPPEVQQEIARFMSREQLDTINGITPEMRTEAEQLLREVAQQANAGSVDGVFFKILRYLIQNNRADAYPRPAIVLASIIAVLSALVGFAGGAHAAEKTEPVLEPQASATAVETPTAVTTPAAIARSSRLDGGATPTPVATRATATPRATRIQPTQTPETPTATPAAAAAELEAATIEVTEERITKYTPGADQNVRSGPGIENPIVKSMDAGESTDVLAVYMVDPTKENSETWLQIGKDQWVAYKYDGATLGTVEESPVTVEAIGGPELDGSQEQLILQELQALPLTIDGQEFNPDQIEQAFGTVQLEGEDTQLLYVLYEAGVPKAAIALTEDGKLELIRINPVVYTQLNKVVAVDVMAMVDANGMWRVVETEAEATVTPTVAPATATPKAVATPIPTTVPTAAATEAAPQVETETALSQMETKLRELMDDYPLMFPPEIIAELDKLSFDSDRGGWIDPTDNDYIYVPTKTTPYITDSESTSLAEMRVWMPADNFVENPETGGKITFGVGAGALVEEVHWANTQEKGAGYVKAFEELLRLPPGVSLKFIIMKDVTLQTLNPAAPTSERPRHLPDITSHDSELMLLVKTTTENVQMFFVEGPEGQLTDATILISVTDAITDNGQRPPEMWAAEKAFNQSGIAYTVLRNFLAGKPITEVSASYAYLDPFKKAVTGLYDKDASGQYIQGQKLFEGEPR